MQISEEQGDVCISRPMQDLRNCPGDTTQDRFLVFVQSALQSLHSDHADQRGAAGSTNEICKLHCIKGSY